MVNGISVPLTTKTIQANGMLLKNDTYVFATADPNMTVVMSQVERQGENVLSVKLELAPLSEELAASMTEGNKKKYRFIF